MLKKISKCKKCKLYFNKKQLLDRDKKIEIMWVGLSTKTSSGKILR